MIFKYLNAALDSELSEFDFWNMTIAEVNRHIKSRNRIEVMKAKERAAFDYILADLIGASVGRLISSSVTYPKLEEAYGSLFEEEKKATEEEKINKKNELSALRFKLFAQSHNEKYKGGKE